MSEEKLRIGFTGTRHGMNMRQSGCVYRLLARASELHHGDCVGADAEAHTIARTAGIRIVSHPPIEDRLRAFCKFDESRSPLPYLARNSAIVDACELLIAVPATADETSRSGTWSTVRYARRVGRQLVIVPPTGRPRWEPAKTEMMT